MKTYPEWKKTITKEHIFHDHLYELSRISRSIETKYISDCQTVRVEGEWGIIANENGFCLGWLNGLKLVLMVNEICDYTKNDGIVYFKEWILWHVTYISIKQLLKKFLCLIRLFVVKEW